MIGILDIGMGNLRSVENAVYQNGFDPVVVTAAANFDDLTHLILPGVGNFSAAVPEIAGRQLKQPIALSYVLASDIYTNKNTHQATV